MSAIYEYAAIAIAPRSSGARVFVTRIAVGPSAPPMIPIEPACIGENPRKRAAKNATNTPSCAPAPIKSDLGFAIRGEKSVIAPTPINMSEG